MDVGVFIGGFIDCLFQVGVVWVYVVDVGYGQLVWLLVKDECVVVYDCCNICKFDLVELGEFVQLVVMDCLFIFVVKVLFYLLCFMVFDVDVVILVKLQFEFDLGCVGKGGIVCEEVDCCEVFEWVWDSVVEYGLVFVDVVLLEFEGKMGNCEWFLWLCWLGGVIMLLLVEMLVVDSQWL